MIKGYLAFGVFITILLVGLANLAQSQSKILSKEKQISAAVSSAPDNMQEQAEVIGYNGQGELTTLRRNNQLVCLADDPEQSNFHVSCYHKDLEPFMKRGRELKAKGLSRKQVDSLRRKEIKSVRLICLLVSQWHYTR
ncbi:MAG: hypothetical protein U5J63_04125 [Fodinibius sp.]|nr:hypothetical protein [Fodinibius sp.]